MLCISPANLISLSFLALLWDKTWHTPSGKSMQQGREGEKGLSAFSRAGKGRHPTPPQFIQGFKPHGNLQYQKQLPKRAGLAESQATAAISSHERFESLQPPRRASPTPPTLAKHGGGALQPSPGSPIRSRPWDTSPIPRHRPRSSKQGPASPRAAIPVAAKFKAC